MHYNRISLLLIGLLLAALLAACGDSATPAGDATATGTDAQTTAVPTQQPTSEAEADPTTVATAQPTEQQPTTTPIASGSEATPTAAGTTPTSGQETPSGAQGLLPSDAVWIFSSDTITALGPSTATLDLAQELQRSGVSQIAASPDGAYIVYSTGSELRLLNAASGESSMVASGEGVASPVFSPDGSRLAYSLISLEGSELRVVDLSNGQEQTLITTGQREPGNLPIAWTAEGIFAQGVIWASDAPPQGLSLVQPDGGAPETLYSDSFQRAIPAPEGRRVALVQGEVPLGEGAPNLGISILDPEAGGEEQILPRTQIWIASVVWSPDGQRLLYTTAATPRDGADTIHMITLGDGAEQQTSLQERGISGNLRDAAWHAGNVLLLVVGDDGMLQVLELAAELEGASPQTLAEIEGSTQLGAVNRILYVPER